VDKKARPNSKLQRSFHYREDIAEGLSNMRVLVVKFPFIGSEIKSSLKGKRDYLDPEQSPFPGYVTK
jgi:hypothetical protein